MEGIQQFKEILDNLQSPQNDIRSAAEQTYETIPSSTKFSFLMNIISTKEIPQQNRIFSGVLCRRLLDVSYDEAFDCNPTETKESIKQQILQLIINENDVLIRKKLTDITMEIARRQFDDEGNLGWPDLLNFVFNVSMSDGGGGSEGLRVTALQIFSGVPNLLQVNTEANFHIVGSTLDKCLSAHCGDGSSQSMKVREAAVRALCSFVVQEFEDNASIAQLRSLIPSLLNTIVDSVLSNPYEDNVMKSFIELVDDAPGFLKNNVAQILRLCITILENEEIEENQKHLAVEIFVSLSESCTNAVRKVPDATHTMMQYLFKMLTDIEDDNDWCTVDEEEIDDDNCNSITAEIALDRLAVAMRGKRLLEEIKQTVPLMLRSSDWKQRHGGLKAISSMGEGLQKVMSEILGSILSEVVCLLGDSHPRVRYAACVCVGQMSTDFEPSLQQEHHETVMPALLSVLGDHANPRVQAYACSALTNFCEGATREVLSLYLAQLAERLLGLLQTKCEALGRDHRKLVLEQLVTTVAAVSDTAGPKFSPYYSDFMYAMKWLMKNCNDESLRLLRGKSIECVSLMGLAVGKEKFLHDGQEVMAMLMATQTVNGNQNNHEDTNTTSSHSDDPQHSYMISAWARICKLMGSDFAPYLEFVMAPVLKTAAMKPETCFMYDEDTDDMGDQRDWQVVRVGQDQNVAINTSGIEDKINACQMLICYARELKAHFAPYVVEVAKVMIPLLKFYLNDDVRSAAADIMPYLVESSKSLQGDDARRQLWEDMMDGLLGALKTEEEKQQQADMLAAIGDSIEKMGANGCMNETRLSALCQLMSTFFEELFKNQEARQMKRKADDYDDEEEETLEADKDDDDNILAQLVGVNHSIFSVYGHGAMGFFQQISSFVMRLLEPQRPSSDLQYGLCFLDDVIEFTGGESYGYVSNFLPVFQGALGHPRPEVRQAAVYGVGLMAMHGGHLYSHFLAESALLMVNLLSMPDSRSADNNLCSENVISALTKLCKYQPNCVPGGNVDRFLPLWASWLPVYEDEEETPHVYGYMCDLLESNNPVMVASDNIVRVVKSVAMCLFKEVLPEEHEVHGRCIRLVKMVQSNEQLFAQCVQNLSDDEKMSLKEALEKAS